jgi:hypothetical protein
MDFELGWAQSMLERFDSGERAPSFDPTAAPAATAITTAANPTASARYHVAWWSGAGKPSSGNTNTTSPSISGPVRFESASEETKRTSLCRASFRCVT